MMRRGVGSLGCWLTILLGLALPPSPLAAQAGVVEVPLHSHEGRLWVPVTAEDGSSFRFLVSTGNPMTVLSATGAARTADAGALHIGGVESLAVNRDGAVTGSDENFTYGGEVFDGLIAPNTLNEFDLLLDHPGGRMLFAPIGRPIRWEGYELSDPVRLTVYHGVAISMQVHLGGTRFPAMLELGTPMIMGNSAVGETGAIDDELAMPLRVGGATWAGLPARVEDLSIFDRWSPNGDPFLMVGGVIALDCAISLSYVRQELRTCVR